jgi:hypothetical protein
MDSLSKLVTDLDQFRSPRSSANHQPRPGNAAGLAGSWPVARGGGPGTTTSDRPHCSCLKPHGTAGVRACLA